VVPPSSSTEPDRLVGAPIQHRFRTDSRTVNNMRGSWTGAIHLHWQSWSLPEQQPTFNSPRACRARHT
jgi:hypothetical protein